MEPLNFPPVSLLPGLQLIAYKPIKYELTESWHSNQLQSKYPQVVEQAKKKSISTNRGELTPQALERKGSFGMADRRRYLNSPAQRSLFSPAKLSHQD